MEFERQKTIACERKIEPKIQFSDFCKSKQFAIFELFSNSFKLVLGNRKALTGIGIGFGFNSFAQFSGNLTILTYSTIIFEKTHTSIDSNISSIMMPVANLIGSLLTTYLADRIGRRILNIFSMFGSAAGLFALALYQYLYLNGFNVSTFVWIPVVSLAFCIFASSVGIQSLVYVCCVEYLPLKVCAKNSKKKKRNSFFQIL